MDVIGFLCISPGTSTVQLHDSLGSRRVSACSEVGFSSQNGDRAWGVCYRKAVFCFALVCGHKDSMQKIFIKKYFLFTVRSVCRVKRFQTRWQTFRWEEVVTEVSKWLRQQPNDFRAAGLDALVKRWGKCINVGGRYAEKCFFHVRISHVLRSISIFDLFTCSPSYLL
jgi:hypothetical protein